MSGYCKILASGKTIIVHKTWWTCVKVNVFLGHGSMNYFFVAAIHFGNIQNQTTICTKILKDRLHVLHQQHFVFSGGWTTQLKSMLVKRICFPSRGKPISNHDLLFGVSTPVLPHQKGFATKRKVFSPTEKPTEFQDSKNSRLPFLEPLAATHFLYQKKGGQNSKKIPRLPWLGLKFLQPPKKSWDKIWHQLGTASK